MANADPKDREASKRGKLSERRKRKKRKDALTLEQAVEESAGTSSEPGTYRYRPTGRLIREGGARPYDVPSPYRRMKFINRETRFTPRVPPSSRSREMELSLP